MNLAHGVGSVYESPLPVSLYVFGAAATVLVSFFIRALAQRGDRSRGPRSIAGPGVAGAVVAAMRAFGLIAFLLLFVFAVAQPEPGLSVTPLLLWVGFIVLGISLQTLCAGLWERTNPWATITEFLGARRERAAITAPVWLGPLLLYTLFWFELVSGKGFDPLAIAIVVLAYTLFVISLEQAFGDDWRFVDPLSVLFGFAGRTAPLELTQEGLIYKGSLRDLDPPEPMPLPWFASIFVLLGATTLDNVRETVHWYSFMRATGLGSVPDRILDSVALLLFLVPFLVPFLAAVWVAQRWWPQRSGLFEDARRLAWSLVPIGVAYLLAHNMPLLITGLPQLVSQIGAEFGLDLFGRYLPSPQLVWFLEIALIVGGHIIGVLAAHRITVGLAPSHGAAVRSHTVLTLLMSAFTIVTLYLLSLPLVVQQS